MATTQEGRADQLAVQRLQEVGTIPLRTRLNRVLYSSQRTPWLLLDAVAALLLFQAGLRLSPYASRPDVLVLSFPLSVVFAVAFALISLGLGSYDRDQRFDYVSIGRNTVVAAVLATLVNLAYHYFTLYAVVGRFTLVYGAMASLLGIVGVRAAVAYAVRQHPYRFTVIGNSRVIEDLHNAWLRTPRQGEMHVLVPWGDIFTEGQDLAADRLVDADVAEIVVAAEALAEEDAINVALLGLRANVPVVDDRAFYGRVFERLPIGDVSKRWILEQGLARPQALVLVAKRVVDVVASTIGLVLLSPVLALVALAVRMSGPGPVIFVQVRQGRFHVPFRIYKFRSMHADASAADGFTRPGDDRVTRVGRVLRRTRLDELPQLFNVLRGEMSLVGPRPEAIEFARRMHAELPLYELRYLVRPGLTGHAQMMHGYAMDNAEDTRVRLSYDLYYLCHYSMRMDLRIMLRTALFLMRGAR